MELSGPMELKWPVLEEPISISAVNFTFESTNRGLKMTTLRKSLAGAVIGAGILAFSAVSASAGIACVGPVSYTHLDVYKRQTFLTWRGGRLSAKPSRLAAPGRALRGCTQAAI